jgi:hypothetical protein
MHPEQRKRCCRTTGATSSTNWARHPARYSPWLFVGLSVSRHWAASRMGFAAGARSLTEAAAPLLVSLFADMPGNRWWIGAVVAGVAGLIATTVYQYFFIRDAQAGAKQEGGAEQQVRRTTAYDRAGATWGFVLLAILFGALFLAGIFRMFAGVHGRLCASDADTWTLWMRRRSVFGSSFQLLPPLRRSLASA